MYIFFDPMHVFISPAKTSTITLTFPETHLCFLLHSSHFQTEHKLASCCLFNLKAREKNIPSVISSYIFHCLYRPLLTYDFKIMSAEQSCEPRSTAWACQKTSCDPVWQRHLFACFSSVVYLLPYRKL